MTINQHAFVTEYLKHNDAITAYCISHNTESSDFLALHTAASELLNHPDVATAIKSVNDRIRADVEQEIRKKMKTELLTVQRKRELLAQIATGEMYVVQTYKGKDCTQCTQHVKPTINQMLKAIDLDNKIAGHYSVSSQQFAKSEKTQQSTTGTSRDLGENTDGTSVNTGLLPNSFGVESTTNKDSYTTPKLQVTENQSPEKKTYKTRRNTTIYNKLHP